MTSVGFGMRTFPAAPSGRRVKRSSPSSSLIAGRPQVPSACRRRWASAWALVPLPSLSVIGDCRVGSGQPDAVMPAISKWFACATRSGNPSISVRGVAITATLGRFATHSQAQGDLRTPTTMLGATERRPRREGCSRYYLFRGAALPAAQRADEEERTHSNTWVFSSASGARPSDGRFCICGAVNYPRAQRDKRADAERLL